MSNKHKSSLTASARKRRELNKNRDPKRRPIVTDTKVIGFWEQPTQLSILAEWASKGLNNTQIAINIGVRRETFSKWANDNEHISNALLRERESVTTEVENAVVKNAMGHKEQIEKAFKAKREWWEDGKRFTEEYIIQGTDEVYIPPNSQSQSLFMKAKRPEEYGDKITVDQSQESIVTVIDKSNMIDIDNE